NEAILPVKDVLLDFTYTGPSMGARSNTVSDPIEMGDSGTITFSGVDLSLVGSYDFEAVIYMPGDEVSANDTLRFTVAVVDQDPQADSMIITAQGGMYFDFDVANPQDAYGYTWDFGDGTNGSGKQLSHTYTTPGQYTVTLTLENGCGTETLTQTLV